MVLDNLLNLVILFQRHQLYRVQSNSYIQHNLYKFNSKEDIIQQSKASSKEINSFTLIWLYIYGRM